MLDAARLHMSGRVSAVHATPPVTSWTLATFYFDGCFISQKSFLQFIITILAQCPRFPIWCLPIATT